MSTRERIYSRIDCLSEEQLKILAAFLDTMETAYPVENAADEVDALCGIFHDAANPELIPLEKNAWAEAAAEKERRFWEEYHGNHS